MNMNTLVYRTAFLGAVITLGLGCANPGKPAADDNPKREVGPDGTVPYEVIVESNPKGSQVEVNGETVGRTPVAVTIQGDRDGTFHNFGSYEFFVRVYSPEAGQRPLTKVYKTGAWMGEEDSIPTHIFFDLQTGTINSKGPDQ